MSTQILPDFIQTRIRSDWSPVARMHNSQAALIAALFRLHYPDLANKCNGRIERAIAICSTVGACRRTDNPTQFVVASESNHLGSYLVDIADKTCTCPDAGKGNLCKHRLAIGFHLWGVDWVSDATHDLIAHVDTPAAQLVKISLEKQRAITAAKAQAALDRQEKIRAAMSAADDAWRNAIAQTDIWEFAASTPNAQGVYKSDDDLAGLRAAMIQALEIANNASDLVNSLLASA